MLRSTKNLRLTNNTDLNHRYFPFETLNCNYFNKHAKDTREDYIILETSEFILQEDDNLIEIEF